MDNSKRVVWIDWMRVMACFMVMLVHSAEPFYLGGNGSYIESASDVWWIAFFDSVARYCVPLFVVASSYLQFPLHYGAAEFFKRRAMRILVPFALWSLFYAFYWGEPATNLKGLLLNFNYPAGHLWFVYMIIGLYIVMPLLSPWAEKVGKKELGAYIGIWLFTTLIPLIRDWTGGAPQAITIGVTGTPRQAFFPLWGEACWNSYGTFYYISGLIGYLLVGLWLRKFGDGISKARSLAVGIPCFIGGFAIVFGGFVRRVFSTAGGVFPVGEKIADAVWWETTWSFDSIGVAAMTIGMILVVRNITASGKFYSRIVLPVSKASYGMYLGHMVALSAYSGLFRSVMESTPLIILSTALCSFVTVTLVAVAVQRIPKIGKCIIG